MAPPARPPVTAAGIGALAVGAAVAGWAARRAWRAATRTPPDPVAPLAGAVVRGLVVVAAIIGTKEAADDAGHEAGP